MDLSVLYLAPDNEMPLDNLTTDGGFCGIFRTNACIGDSLSSGEFEPCDKSGNLEFGDIETDININDYQIEAYNILTGKKELVDITNIDFLTKGIYHFSITVKVNDKDVVMHYALQII